MSNPSKPTVFDLGNMPYQRAYGVQCEHHEQVLASRDSSAPEIGRILTVEHPPVITVTRRPQAAGHVVASEELLRERGVEVCPTDRGGDVTYHGPGQLVCYPIVDLNAAKLRLHDYIRLLEQAVIMSLAEYDLTGLREEGATGVWIQHAANGVPQFAKVAAIGVRIRRWVTLHGISVNIDPDMDHFNLIVPCGLAGRPVVSLRMLLGSDCPTVAEFGRTLTDQLAWLLMQNIETSSPTHRYTSS